MLCHLPNGRKADGSKAVPGKAMPLARESELRYPIKAFGYDKYTLLCIVFTVRNLAYSTFFYARSLMLFYIIFLFYTILLWQAGEGFTTLLEEVFTSTIFGVSLSTHSPRAALRLHQKAS